MEPDILTTNVGLGISTNLANLMNTQAGSGLLNESFLWASCLWGAVAGGYLVYARKQRSIPVFLGGAVMMAVACFVTSWFWMSVTCIALMFGVYLAARQDW